MGTPIGDQGGDYVTTLTKGEFDRVRNGAKPSKAAPAKPARLCEVCGNPMPSARHSRTCSQTCAGALGGQASAAARRQKTAQAPRKAKAPVSGARKRPGHSLDWLSELPADVMRVEVVHDGWRAEFSRV